MNTRYHQNKIHFEHLCGYLPQPAFSRLEFLPGGIYLNTPVGGKRKNEFFTDRITRLIYARIQQLSKSLENRCDQKKQESLDILLRPGFLEDRVIQSIRDHQMHQQKMTEEIRTFLAKHWQQQVIFTATS